MSPFKFLKVGNMPDTAKLKPSLSTKILSINDFITKLLSKLLRDFSNKVHLKSISKFINEVINKYFFCTEHLKTGPR